MTRLSLILAPCLLLALGGAINAPAKEPLRTGTTSSSRMALAQPGKHDDSSLDTRRERRAMQVLLKTIEKHIVSAADAMPADKYGFAPSEGEFKGVRTFAQQAKHLAATNHILAAAALGEDQPADAGDELGPPAVRSKAEILSYVSDSFAHLDRALAEVGERKAGVRSSPISPLPPGVATRFTLIVEALLHANDHYGQMVEYLRMNGVVPPASRP